MTGIFNSEDCFSLKSRKIFRGIILISVLALFSILPITEVSAAPNRELLISAASSLTDAVTEISKLFMERHPEITVRCNFASSGALRRQIEMGVLPDVYLSASMKQVEILLEKQIVKPANVFDFVSNSIVLVIPGDSADKFSGLGDLAKIQGRVAIGTPGVVPVGTYAREALEKAGVYKPLEAAGRLVFCDNVRQVVHYVSTGNVAAGVVFGTDAVLFAKELKTAFPIPSEMHSRIRYARVTIPGRDSADAAMLHEFLKTEQVRGIMEKFGFIWNLTPEQTEAH